MTTLQEKLTAISSHDAVTVAHDAAMRIDGLERQLREWCEWHLMARHGCTLVQAHRVMAGENAWPREAPSNEALVLRTIRFLSENETR